MSKRRKHQDNGHASGRFSLLSCYGPCTGLLDRAVAAGGFYEAENEKALRHWPRPIRRSFSSTIGAVNAPDSIVLRFLIW